MPLVLCAGGARSRPIVSNGRALAPWAHRVTMASAKPTPNPAFFKTVFQGETEADSQRFLTEVEAQFASEDLREEVRWRLDVLRELAGLPDLNEATEGLKKRLTQVFSSGGDESTVLAQLRELTEVEGQGGEKIDLRRFLKRGRRTYTEEEYRIILGKKLENTRVHVVNLVAFYPQTSGDLNKLAKVLEVLNEKLGNPAIPVQQIKAQEDKLRETVTFRMYEDLKVKFLRDWLGRFSTLSPAEIAGLTGEQVQQLIQEHQRHQLSQLIKHKIALSDMDMTESLGVHDTLECEFHEQAFWEGANDMARQGFRQWILSTVQAFGMLKGQRYACFQSQTDKDQFLLFGLGVSSLPRAVGDPMVMVPYIKPFTRKATYLLEIRRREIGNADTYYHELVHYLIPFLYAFDQMKDFKVAKELLTFFNNRYAA
jgi:hypothetical protein